MQIFGAIGGGAFILASLVLGLRLMLLSRRTHGLPELLLGYGLFGMGGIGYPAMAVAVQAEGLAHGVRMSLLVLHILVTVTGMIGLAVFTRRVFRPHAGWAHALVFGIGLVYVGLALVQALGPGLADLLVNSRGPWSWNAVAGIGAMAWGGAESLHYHGLLQKRAALGLADRLLVDRFRLWAVAMAASATISVCTQTADRLFGIEPTSPLVGGLVIFPLGIVSAAALWLAFLPPAFYRARFAAQA